MSKDFVKEEQVEDISPQFTINLDDLPKQQHNWVNRGLKMTCETPAHPYHEAWFKRTI